MLFEGAQGTLLDLDHGTYPFVTSSNPMAGGACTGQRHRADADLDGDRRRQGVPDARRRRAVPERGRRRARRRALREIGAEFGTVTGRERRCGWLDLVGLRFAARVNGMTELVLTKLDVLSSFDDDPRLHRLPAARRARSPPTSRRTSPTSTTPAGVFEELPGWGADISRVTSYADLPAAARDYVAGSRSGSELPVTLVGVGQRRDQILAPRQRVGVA